jgi:hypothetical protein
MDKRLQEMLDHYEITKLLNEYCHGCDRMDQVYMASVYSQNSWDDHGRNKCPGPEFASRTMNDMQAMCNMCSHLMGQTLIRISGDEAGAESYFIATVRSSTDEGGELLKQLGGRYIDTFVREAGQWRIKRRICVRDWSISQPISNDWLAGAGFVEGQRSNDDASASALGIRHSGMPPSRPRDSIPKA